MNTNPLAKTVLCFGDSNTWGQKPDKSERFGADERWTGLLQQALGDDYYVIEEGLNSRTTDLEYTPRPGRNGSTYLLPCLDSHRPLDNVILMLGTNDLKTAFGRSAPAIAAALGRLVKIIRERTALADGSSAKVILVSPILIDSAARHFAEFYSDIYELEAAEKSKQLAPEVQKVAQSSGCSFVDAASVASPGEDSLHLDRNGHRGLAELLRTAV